MNLTNRLTAVAAVLVLPGFTLLSAARADLASATFGGETFGSPGLDAVNPLDTFNIAVAAFDSAGTNGIFLVSTKTPTFGVPFTAAGSGPTTGQTVSVTSSETIGATTTTDTITISVPTNFSPVGTTSANGGVVSRIELNIGGFNAGTNTLDFTLPITSPTYAGTVLFGTNSTIALSPGATLSNANQSLAVFEGVNSGTADISTFNVRSFTFSVTYPTVPEPSTWALLGVGLVGGLGLAVRRRRVAA